MYEDRQDDSTVFGWPKKDEPSSYQSDLDTYMFRVDRAIGKLRENRLNRKDADELIAASMNLMNIIRLKQNGCYGK